MWLYISDKNERLPLNLVSKLYRLVLFRVPVAYCQTPLQLADPTQLQLVGIGVDFVFPLDEEEEGRKEEGRKNNPHPGSSRESDPTCLKFLVSGGYLWDV